MVDVAPKTGRASAGGTPRTKAAPKTSSKTQIKTALTEQTKLVSMAFAMKGDLYPSLVMEQVGPSWADSMAEMAESSPQLKRILTLATQGGVAGAAVLSTAIMVMPILAYYGALPAAAAEGAAQLPMVMGDMTDEAKNTLVEAWNMKYGSPEDPRD